QVRTVLLKRAYRHAKDRTCAQAPGDLEKCQVADCSARHRTFHGATIHQLRTLGGAFYQDSSVAVCCQCRGTSPRLWRLARRSEVMAEPMSGPLDLCGHIAAVVGVYRCLERHPADNLNSGLGEAIEFGRVVGE